MFLIPDDFFSRAIIAGIGFTLVAGPLGCFVIWQRLSYLGEAMAHSALLGIALAIVLDMNLMVGVFSICLLISFILARVNSDSFLSGDSVLGIMSHSTLALGLVLVSFMYWIRVDVLDFLFGNIIAVTWLEIAMIYMASAVALGIIAFKWRAMIVLTVDEQIAAAEGLQPSQTRILLMILLAGTIAIAMKIVGILLTISLLIIPAATARQLAKTPEQMAVFAVVFGSASVVGGMFMSLEIDTPPGPSIVVCALLLFLSMATAMLIRKRIREDV